MNSSRAGALRLVLSTHKYPSSAQPGLWQAGVPCPLSRCKNVWFPAAAGARWCWSCVRLVGMHSDLALVLRSGTELGVGFWRHGMLACCPDVRKLKAKKENQG